jgi:hypothetical protein
LGVQHDTTWSRGEAWSSRRPVKPEAAGSNPVGTAARRRASPSLNTVERKLAIKTVERKLAINTVE